MERSRRHHHWYFGFKILEVLSRFQKSDRTSALTPETLKIISGFTLIFVSMLLGWLSLSSSKEAGALEYQTTHWPPRPIWRQTLLQAGFKNEFGNEKAESLLRSVAPDMNSHNELQITQDGCALFLPHSPYQETAEVWSRCTTSDHPVWTKIGTGYLGVEKLMKIIEKTQNRPKNAVKIKVKSIDPKEFHY